MINKKNISGIIKSGKEKADAFNAKYQSNLDLNHFINKVIQEEKRGNQNAWNDVYQSTIGEFYKKAMSNMLTKNPNQINADVHMGDHMLDDFERDVMAWLSSNCERAGVQTNAQPYGGMDQSQRLNLMKAKLEEIPATTYVSLASHQYSNGQTRIRDMVSFAREAIGANVKNNPDAQKRIMGNILALERINESRSRFWRTIHPFRNKAEQRDAELMRQMLREAIGQKAYQDAEESALDSIDFFQKVSDQLQEDIEGVNELLQENERDEPNYENDLDSELDFDVDDDLDYDMDNDLDKENSYDSSFREPIKIEDDEPGFTTSNFITDKESDKARLERFKKENEQFLKRP